MRGHAALFFVVLLPPASIGAQSSQWAGLRPGPHVPGFRVIETMDRARATRPLVDYNGNRARNDIAVPVQLAIWYPAVRSARAPMSTLDLLLVAERKERFGRATAQDSASVRAKVAGAARIMGADSTRADARPESTLRVSTAAVRDAAPAAGRFPVVVVGASGTIASVSVLAEYLASNGWVVVATPSSAAVAALEATDPPLAIEDRVAAMGIAVATAHTLPFADPLRLALLGVNFDSFAALELQMRNMYASAVVTINGWHVIDDRAAHLRRSLWYEPNRVRVPLLNFHWDEARPGSEPSLGFLTELRYADRRNVVIRGLDHFGLVFNPLLYPFASPAQRAGYALLARSVLATLNGAEGVPTDSLALAEVRLPAVAAAPTRSEFLELLGSPEGLPGAMRVFREVRARDSSARLFRESDLNLYVFRATVAKRFDDAVEIGRMVVEAYPGSFHARNGLGNTYLARGDTASAIREFEQAIALLEADGTLAPEARAAQLRAWRDKVDRLRRTG